MILERLSLRDFRNYQSLQLDLHPGLNIFAGPNAQGKTNILEAIYFLSTAKSHRTSREQDLLRWGTDLLQAKAELTRHGRRHTLELSYDTEKKKQVRINGLLERRVSSLIGKMPVVFFSPDDLQLLKGAPALRRRFLDIELSQISSTYLHHLQQFNKVLLQRNTLLRMASSGGGPLNTIEVWDEQLAEHGAQIIYRRDQAVLALAGLAHSLHGRLTSGSEDLTLDYCTSAPLPARKEGPSGVKAFLTAEIDRRRREEVRRGVSLVGPHRDDLHVAINGSDSRLYASQGQQRTAVLSLKLAELSFMQSEIGEEPILLLDDVASELDPRRREYLLATVADSIQTLLTCTNPADLGDRPWPSGSRLFFVQSGQVQIKE